MVSSTRGLEALSGGSVRRDGMADMEIDGMELGML